MPIRLDQFRSVSSGKWNAGSVVLNGNELSKVNNHQWDISKNTKKNTASENLAVRTAFYESVREFLYGGLGVGTANEKWNAYLAELHSRLFDKKAGSQDLTRKMIRSEIATIDTKFAEYAKEFKLNDANVKDANKPEGLDDGRQTGSYSLKDWSWNYTSATGLNRKSINRICRSEGDAVRFLVNELAQTGKVPGKNAAERRHNAEVLALKRISGQMQLAEGDLANNDCKAALQMLNSGFTTESIKGNCKVAKRLCEGLRNLSREVAKKGAAAAKEEIEVSLASEGDTLADLKLKRLRDGRLAVSYTPTNVKNEDEKGVVKSVTLGLPAVHYEYELDRAIARLTAEDLQGRDDLREMQDELFKGLPDRLPAKRDLEHAELLKHIRTVATIALTQEGVPAAKCEKIPVDALSRLARAIVVNTGHTDGQKQGEVLLDKPTAENVSPFCTSSSDSMEFVELQECLKAEAKKVEEPEAKNPEDGDIQLLADVAYAIMDGNGTAALSENAKNLDAIVEKYRNGDENLLKRLSPAAKHLVETLSSLLGADKLSDLGAAELQGTAENVRSAVNTNLAIKLGLLAESLEPLLDSGKYFKDKTPPDVSKSTETFESMEEFARLLFETKNISQGDKGTAKTFSAIERWLDGGCTKDRLNQRKSVVKPELYACRPKDAKDGFDLGDPFVKEDVFDLLAATITSPDQVKALDFPGGKKPSVDGAHAIVNSMLKSLYNASLWEDHNPGQNEEGEDKEPDAQKASFKKIVGGLSNFLAQPPACLEKGIVNAALHYETIKNNVENGAHEICPDFMALLGKLPGPTVSAVLKGLCREVIFRNQELHEGMDGDASAYVEYSAQNINPIYEQMKAWRDPMFGDSSQTMPIDFKTLDPERDKEVRASFESSGKQSNNEFVDKVLPTYLRKIQDRPELMAKMLSLLVREGGKSEQTGKEGIDWSFFGDVAKGLGPIMQKYLQAYEIPVHASDEMRKAFKDLKDNLSRPSMDYVNAQLAFIKQTSGGRITGIEFKEFLGCATVGAAAKCHITTADNPKGEDCVIKFLRPDVRNVRANEQTFLGEVFTTLKKDKYEEVQLQKKDELDRKVKNIDAIEIPDAREIKWQNEEYDRKIGDAEKAKFALENRLRQAEFYTMLCLDRNTKLSTEPNGRLEECKKIGVNDVPAFVKRSIGGGTVVSCVKITKFKRKNSEGQTHRKEESFGLEGVYIVSRQTRAGEVEDVLVMGPGQGPNVAECVVPVKDLKQPLQGEASKVFGKYYDSLDLGNATDYGKRPLDREIARQEENVRKCKNEKEKYKANIESKKKGKAEQEEAYAQLKKDYAPFEKTFEENQALAEEADGEYKDFAKTINNLKDSNAKRFESIENELDFRVEHYGICEGLDAYTGKSPTVQSVDELSFVVPDSSFIIMKLVDGSTVNSDVRKADELTRKFDRINNSDVAKIDNSNAMGEAEAATLADWAETMEALLKSRGKLIRSREHLASAIEVWFAEALGPKGHGFFHADLHAGNIMTDDKKATLIDFGNYARLDEKTKGSIRKLFTSVVNGDAESFLKGIKSLNFTAGGVSPDDLKSELETLLAGGVKDGNDPELVFRRFSRAINLLRKHGIEAPDTVKNFFDSQVRLANSITEVNQRLQLLDQAVESAGEDRRWHLEHWPISAGEHTRQIQVFEDHAQKLREKVFVQHKGNANPGALDNAAKRFNNAMDGIRKLKKNAPEAKPLSYGSVIGKMAMSWAKSAE